MRVLPDKRVVGHVNVGDKGIKSGRRRGGESGGEMSRGVERKFTGGRVGVRGRRVDHRGPLAKGKNEVVMGLRDNFAELKFVSQRHCDSKHSVSTVTLVRISCSNHVKTP